MDGLTTLYLQLFLKDSGRIFNAIRRINALNGWEQEKRIEVLQARIIHGVGEKLIELVSIPGIGGTIATQLYKAGIKTLEEVKSNKDRLGDIIARKGNVTRILNGLKELEEEQEVIDF